MKKISTIMGERLNYLRNKKGITLAEIAKILECTSRAISYWETGKRDIPHEKLIKICDIFKVDPNYFFTPEEKTDIFDIERRLSELEKAINKIAHHIHIDVDIHKNGNVYVNEK